MQGRARSHPSRFESAVPLSACAKCPICNPPLKFLQLSYDTLSPSVGGTRMRPFSDCTLKLDICVCSRIMFVWPRDTVV